MKLYICTPLFITSIIVTLLAYNGNKNHFSLSERVATVEKNDSSDFYRYIDNGILRLGIDMSAGGSIFYLAENSTGRNLLNHYDKGRFIQQSYYGNMDGSIWTEQEWKWNPIQGGGATGEAANVLEQKIGKDNLYIKSRPKHWATGVDIEDAVMEQYIKLTDSVAHIHYIFTYTGIVNHSPQHQELPAVFVDAALPNLVFYDGETPWTKGELTSRIPGWPNEYGRITEHWAAYVDSTGWGLGAYIPGVSELTFYRYIGHGKDGPEGDACSYFAPVKSFGVTSGLKYEYDVYLRIGKIEDIRTQFYRIREK